MPLEDLTALGFEIYRPIQEDGTPPVMASVWGFGQQWNLSPGQDEEAVVAEVRNHKSLYDKMTQVMSTFADNYANWGSMTAAQKDSANRNAQRALANLVRQTRGDLSSGGV